MSLSLGSLKKTALSKMDTKIASAKADKIADVNSTTSGIVDKKISSINDKISGTKSSSVALPAGCVKGKNTGLGSGGTGKRPKTKEKSCEPVIDEEKVKKIIKDNKNFDYVTDSLLSKVPDVLNGRGMTAKARSALGGMGGNCDFFPDMSLPSFGGLSGFSMPDLDLPDFNLPSFGGSTGFNLPDFNLPSLNLPDFNLPDIDLPDFDMPGINTNGLFSGISDMDFGLGSLHGGFGMSLAGIMSCGDSSTTTVKSLDMANKVNNPLVKKGIVSGLASSGKADVSIVEQASEANPNLSSTFTDTLNETTADKVVVSDGAGASKTDSLLGKLGNNKSFKKLAKNKQVTELSSKLMVNETNIANSTRTTSSQKVSMFGKLVKSRMKLVA